MRRLWNRVRARCRRLVSFGLVGCVNTALDYAVFFALYRLAAAPVWLSQTAGFLCGSLCGYVLNSRLTFRAGRGRTKAQWAQYLGVDVVLALFSSAFLHWAEARGHAPVLLLKLAVTAAVFLLHYVIYKHLVFRIRRTDDAESGAETPNEGGSDDE